MRPSTQLHSILTILLLFLLPSCREDRGSEPGPEARGNAAAAVEDGAPVAVAPKVRRIRESYPTVGPFPYPPAPELLEQGFTSIEELMWTLMKAVDAGDVDLLREYLVEQEFYLARLFPEFERVQPSLKGRGEFHWDHLEMKSLSGILDLRRLYGGKGLEFRLFVAESVEEHRSFRLHRQPTVMCYEPASGQVRPYTYKLINDIVEFDGRFKLLGYPN